LRERAASDGVPPRPDRQPAASVVARPDRETPADPFASWRRLHPAAIAVWLSSIVGQLGLFIALALVLRGDGPPQFFAIAAASIAAMSAVVRWMRLSFRIERDTLIIRGGLLSRWRRVLPFSRIQSVDVVRKLTHRLFGVVELRVEVAGGRETEAPLVALSPHDADVIRAILLSEEAAHARPDTPPLVRMRPAQLLLAGVTGGRIAVAAALLGWMQQFLTEETAFRYFERVVAGGRSGLVVALIVGAFVLIASVTISLVGTILVFWNFTARRDGDRLVITRGLLQIRRAVVPIHRIQAIRLEENLLRRVFGLASLHVITAGYAQGEDQQRTSMLLPIAGRAACLDLASRVLRTPADVVDARLEPAPRRALARRLAVAGLFGGAVSAGGMLVFELGLVWAAVVIFVAFALALLSWRALGHAVMGRHVVARSGALVRRSTIAAHGNVQHLSLVRSPTQRMLGLATVRLSIPRATTLMSDLDGAAGEDRFALLARGIIADPEGS
jgi:putative membrane protein